MSKTSQGKKLSGLLSPIRKILHRQASPAPPPTETIACRVPAESIDEYVVIGGLPTTPPDPLARGERMKERGRTAYRGLIAVVQALSDCSDGFLPLQTGCNIILTIHNIFDVRSNSFILYSDYFTLFFWFAEGVVE
jgi:hypothetical protein